MRRLVRLSTILAALLLAGFGVQAQCTCPNSSPANRYRGSWFGTVADEYENSEVVFVGTVVSEQRVDEPPDFDTDSSHNYRVRFKVEKAWKRFPGLEAEVWMDAGCLIGFRPGESYLVYASPIDGRDAKRLWVKYCSRTRLLERASRDLAEIERLGRKPL